MGLMQQAANDASNYLTNSAGWAIAATFTANDIDHTEATVNALCIKHNTEIDPQTGLATNSTVARVTVSEQALLELDYPVRNDRGDVAMINHTVTWSDLNDEYTYKIRETWPNEMLGCIVLILAKLKT
jgi:hypothetical protein